MNEIMKRIYNSTENEEKVWDDIKRMTEKRNIRRVKKNRHSVTVEDVKQVIENGDEKFWNDMKHCKNLESIAYEVVGYLYNNNTK